MKSRIPWKLKMDKPAAPEVKQGPEEWNTRYGGTKMLIPTPRLIEKILWNIPKGKLLKLSELRAELAEECAADYACPLTTGIFLRICAEYAEELRSEGQKNIPAYWRVIRDDGSFFEKFPGGIAHQIELLKSEGHTILIRDGRKPRIKLPNA